MPDRFVTPACGGVGSAGLETALRLGSIGRSKQPVSLRDCESRFPSMALRIGRDKSVGHLAFLGRGGFEAAATDLRNIGH